MKQNIIAGFMVITYLLPVYAMDMQERNLPEVHMQDQEVVMVPYNLCTLEQLGTIILSSGGEPLLLFVVIVGWSTLMGAFAGIPIEMSLDPVVLKADAQLAGGCVCLVLVAKSMWNYLNA